MQPHGGKDESQLVEYLFLEILELDLGKDDKYIVLASDGVWEFLQNDEVAAIVRPFYETKNDHQKRPSSVEDSLFQ